MRNKTFLVFALTLAIMAFAASPLFAGGQQEGGTSPAMLEDIGFREEDLPIVDDTVTLTGAGDQHAFSRQGFSEMSVFQELERDTNVSVEWDLVPASAWQEKRNLIIASGDLPGILLNFGSAGGATDGEIIQYADDGVIIPLNDLIDEYGEYIKNVFQEFPDIQPQLTAPDGNIYSLPRGVFTRSTRHNVTLLINQTWLDELGMALPQTTEDFREMLRAFRDNDLNGNGDPNDEIPFTFLYDDNVNYGIYPIFGAFGQVDYPNHLIVQDGRAVFTAATDEWKEGVKYLHSLYAEDLIDPEAFTMKQPELLEKASSEDNIIGAYMGFSPGATFSSDARIVQYSFVEGGLIGPDGDQKWPGDSAFFHKGAFGITSTNEFPEVTMRWIDQVYEPWRSFEFGQGPIGYRWEMRDDGQLERIKPPEGMTNGEHRYFNSPANNFPYILFEEINDLKVKPTPLWDRREAVDAYWPYLEFSYYPDILMEADDVDALARYNVDIQEYTKRRQAEWITTGGIEEEWQDHLDRLDRIGLSEMLAIYQKYLDN